MSKEYVTSDNHYITVNDDNFVFMDGNFIGQVNQYNDINTSNGSYHIDDDGAIRKISDYSQVGQIHHDKYVSVNNSAESNSSYKKANTSSGGLSLTKIILIIVMIALFFIAVSIGEGIVGLILYIPIKVFGISVDDMGSIITFFAFLFKAILFIAIVITIVVLLIKRVVKKRRNKKN